MVRRIAAMLDLEVPTLEDGDVLPRGWHFFLLAGETRKSALRPDGFPGLGVPVPELGLPRLLLGGRNVVYHGDITIGSQVERTSFVRNIVEKNTASGRIAIVTIQHALRPVTEPHPVITENQTYILMGEKRTGQATPEIAVPAFVEGIYQKQLIPDETHLFQYSALGFNSHKIHLDVNYTREIEGLPDLVVNGGLATLFMTEFLRLDLGLEPKEITVKHLAPLYCQRPMTLSANRNESDWQLVVYDEKFQKAIEAIVKI
jgi:3-methylfumaryl-CoA hydratase